VIDMHGEGQGQVAAMLAAVADRALNPEPAFDAITDRLVDAEKRLFAAKARFKPDKDATRERKARDKRAEVRATRTA
jgi:hypothetical protein